MVGPSTYKLLCNLITPQKPGELSYDELVQSVRKNHNPTPSEIVQRFKFNSRVRQPGESVATFLAELRALAKFCNYGDTLDSMLRDRMVCGINDLQIQKRLLAESDLTLKKATDLALGMEAAVKNAQAIQSSSIESKSSPKEGSLNKVRSAFPRKGGKGSQECYGCGNMGHTGAACKHRSTECHSCGKLGHLSKMCHSKKKKTNNSRPQKVIHTVGTDLTDDYQLYRIHSTQEGKASSNPFVLRIQVDDQPIQMEIDTGASVSILSSATYKENFSEKPLQASSVVLRTYAEDPLTNLGSLTVEVQHNARKMNLPLLVIEGNGPNLLGRDWLEKLRIDWRSIHHVTGTEADREFSEVFQEGLGTLKGFKATIHVDQDVNPVFCKARPVPYALKPLVEQELANLEKDGVISPIAFSDWAAPIVPVLKSNRSVRICGDLSLQSTKFPNWTDTRCHGSKTFSRNCQEDNALQNWISAKHTSKLA